MSFLSQLNEYADYYDLQSMNSLVESLSPAALEENKQAIIGMYELVFRSGMYDLDYDKVTNRQEFIFFLLQLLDSIQRFFPDEMYQQERGRCYGYLADCAAAYGHNAARYLYLLLRCAT